MNLQEKSYTELKALFNETFKVWQASNFSIKMVQEKECVKYNDFVQNRAELRALARQNSRLHNRLVQIDLELQLRTWTGKND